MAHHKYQSLTEMLGAYKTLSEQGHVCRAYDDAMTRHIGFEARTGDEGQWDQHTVPLWVIRQGLADPAMDPSIREAFRASLVSEEGRRAFFGG